MRIASVGVPALHDDEAYGGRNLVEYADQTRAFDGVVADVLALPEPLDAVDTWLQRARSGPRDTAQAAQV